MLYVLLAYLAVRVALGQPNRQADRQGALHTIAHEPFGRVVLVVVAGGFAAYTLWQFSVALLGGSARAGSDRPARRVLAFLTAILYAFFCFSAAAIAAGTSRAGAAGGDTQEVDRTAILMRHSFGRLVAGVAGAAVIAAGGVLCWKALSGRQETVLRPMARGPRRAVEALGVAGTTARAVTIAGVGVFVLEAAVDLNPRKARGLDGTLKSFAHTPVGHGCWFWWPSACWRSGCTPLRKRGTPGSDRARSRVVLTPIGEHRWATAGPPS